MNYMLNMVAFKESQIALSKAGAAGAARIKEIMDNLRKDAPT